MGKLIERLKRGKEILRQRIAATRAKREIKQAIRTQKLEGKREEAEEKREKRAAEIIKKQERISKVREAQLKRAKLEAGILKAKAQRVTAQRKIIGRIGGRGVALKLGGPIIQPSKPTKQPAIRKQPQLQQVMQRPPGAALMDFAIKPQQKIKKKGSTPGLGRFRVL